MRVWQGVHKAVQTRGAPVCDNEAAAGGSDPDVVRVGPVRGWQLLHHKRLFLHYHCLHIFLHSGTGRIGAILCGMQTYVGALPAASQVSHHQIHCLLDLLASTTAS